jgi:hypothetical protein
VNQDRFQDLEPIIKFLRETGGSPILQSDWYGLIMTDLRLALKDERVRFIDWSKKGNSAEGIDFKIFVLTERFAILEEYVTSGEEDERPEASRRGALIWDRADLRQLRVSGDRDIRDGGGPGTVRLTLTWSDGSETNLPMGNEGRGLSSMSPLIPGLREDLRRGNSRPEPAVH